MLHLDVAIGFWSELFDQRRETRSAGRRRGEPVCPRGHRARARRRAHRASLEAGPGRCESSRPPRCQRTSCLRSATLATSEPASLVLHAALRQRRGQQVGDGRKARRLFVSRRAAREARPRGPPGPRRGSPGSRWLRFRERGPVEVAECLQVAAIPRLALGDGHEQVVADDLAQRPVLSPRLVFAPLGTAGGPSPDCGGSVGAGPAVAASGLRRRAGRSIR